MSGGVLALDLATNLGWACGRLPARPLTPLEAMTTKPPQPKSGERRIDEPGSPVGRFLHRYEHWLNSMVDRFWPAGIIFEAPILPKKTAPATVRKLMSLVGVTQMVAHRRSISWVREAQPSKVKLHFCGDGGPGKEGVTAACMARGWVFAGDDEADALALWDYAATLHANERKAAA